MNDCTEWNVCMKCAKCVWNVWVRELCKETCGFENVQMKQG